MTGQAVKSTLDKRIAKALEERYPMPEEILVLSNLANHDLYFGPYPEGEEFDDGFIYPGFETALGKVQDWVEENVPSELYYNDMFEELLDNEPEGYEDEETGEWVEADYEDVYKLERRDIMSKFMGKELATYI